MKNRPRIVLASASPRRRELLASLGLEFDVVVADVDESQFNTDRPRIDVLESARAKAREVARRIDDGLVIGADTMVVLGDRVFGKPVDREHAREIIQALSGRAHVVLTGVAIIDVGSGREVAEVDETRVVFREIADGELELYLDSPDPYDKAGAYGIQSSGGQFVERVEGDYFNVVGFPLTRLARMLAPFLDGQYLTVPPPPWPR